MSKNDEKPKRNSFWESEIPAVRNWCRNQKNLGTSLELIIPDVIRLYGEGDVIKAYLNKRMNDMLSQGSPLYVSFEDEQRMLSDLPISDQEPDFQTNVTHQSEVTGSSATDDQKNGDGFVEPQRVAIEKNEHSDPEEDRNLPQENIGSGTQFQGSGNDADYDPIAILMRDAGSHLD